MEFKFSEAPNITKSMWICLADLKLDHLWVVYPGKHSYPADEKLSILPIQNAGDLVGLIDYGGLLRAQPKVEGMNERLKAIRRTYRL